MIDQIKLERLIERLKKDSSISKRNRELILSFVERCSADGIKAKRQFKYIYGLKKIALMLGKDLDKTNKEDLQRLVARINTSSFKEWTKHDYKVTIKKFYKLMEGNDDDPDYCPKKIRWMKTTMKEEDFVNPNELLRSDDVDRIVSFCDNILHKTICRFLFESGVRAGELLSMKIKDVNLKEGYITIQGTKTKYSKRTIPIVQSVPLMAQWFEVHPDCDPESYLWLSKRGQRISYNNLCYILKEGAKRAGIKNKKVNPHAWRKASATENSKYLKYPELCTYHGWKIGSDIPMLYIRYTQEDIKKALQKRNGLVMEKEEERPQIKKCRRCEKTCEQTASFCPRCGFMFSDSERVSRLNELNKRRQKSDVLMNIVSKHPQFMKMLEQILEKEGYSEGIS